MGTTIETYARLRPYILLILCALMFELTANDVRAQQQASVSGTYCGTWASGNYWRMTLRQKGSDISASLTGRTPDGRPFTGAGNGAVSGSQISVPVTFIVGGQSGASGTFSGTLSGRSISATFSRGRGDSANFIRC
jgi:hypothetical protein